MMKTLRTIVYLAIGVTLITLISAAFTTQPILAQERGAEVVKFITDENTNLKSHPELLNYKYCKMSCSPFAFYRATDSLLWRDLTGDFRMKEFGNSKTKTWLTGDQHVDNFGAFANSKGEIVFDLNDFDESVIADYQYDLWRMAASIVLVEDQQNKLVYEKEGKKLLSKKEKKELIEDFAESYLDTLDSYRGNNNELQISFTKDETASKLKKVLNKIEEKNQKKNLRVKMLDKWFPTDSKGERHYNTANIKLGKASDVEKETITKAMPAYGKTLVGDLNYNEKTFHIKDIAKRLRAGLGSLGTSRYYVLIEGESISSDDDRILDVKLQSQPTPFAFLSTEQQEQYDRSFENDAQRHQVGYLALSKDTDNYLGWMQLSVPQKTKKDEDFSGYYSVRERSPFKESLETIDLTSKKSFEKVVKQWARILATAHARADKDFDASLVPYSFEDEVGKLTDGNHKEFRKLVREVAFAYAEQVDADYNDFTDTLKPKPCADDVCQ